VAASVGVQKAGLGAIGVLIGLLLIHEHGDIIAEPPAILVQLLGSSEKERILSRSSHIQAIRSTGFPLFLIF